MKSRNFIKYFILRIVKFQNGIYDLETGKYKIPFITVYKR